MIILDSIPNIVKYLLSVLDYYYYYYYFSSDTGSPSRLLCLGQFTCKYIHLLIDSKLSYILLEPGDVLPV